MFSDKSSAPSFPPLPVLAETQEAVCLAVCEGVGLRPRLAYALRVLACWAVLGHSTCEALLLGAVMAEAADNAAGRTVAAESGTLPEEAATALAGFAHTAAGALGLPHAGCSLVRTILFLQYARVAPAALDTLRQVLCEGLFDMAAARATHEAPCLRM